MKTAEQIRCLCAATGMSVSELAVKFGTSPQNFYAKLKRNSFKKEELEKIASLADAEYIQFFRLQDGSEIH